MSSIVDSVGSDYTANAKQAEGASLLCSNISKLTRKP